LPVKASPQRELLPVTGPKSTSSNATANATESKTRKQRATTLYPKVSLIDALRLAESIRDNNASSPYNRIDLAASVDLSPESSTLRTLITASNKFGLTEGSYAAEKITLTDLGRKIVSPTSDEEKAQGLMTALYMVDFYKDFFERFKNHRLPRKDLLLNTLEREFHIPRADRDQCYELLVKNATELGLLKDVGGTLYVRFDQPSVIAEVSGSDHDQDAPVLDEIQPIALPVTTDIKPAANLRLPREVVPEAATTHKPTIFISHSKNMKILTQIKSNLEFGGFSYKVAIETETTAIPIPEKIFGMMRDCNCAIVNVSADEQERREDGTYGINANVLVEIGAAFLAYNQRVILLVDKRLTLPSNLQGLYRCEYTGDELDSSALTRLQKGLLQFRVPVD
jgi:predicted nucleotide-binding protein